MNKKRLTAGAAAVCLSLTLCLPISAAGGGASLEEASQVVSALGILAGDESGNLNLSRRVTRAEFVTMAVKASPSGELVGQAATSPYPDVPRDHWASGYVEAGVSRGLISGYSDGTFRPGLEIKLAEGVTIALSLLGYGPEDFSGAYPTGQMALYHSLRLDRGMSASGPSDPMTRQDALYLFYNLLSARTKEGSPYLNTLGYSLNAAGEPDLLSLINGEMEGPIVAQGSNWREQLPFPPAQGKVFRDGASVSPSALREYDLIYWNPSAGTVWACSKKLSGTIQALEPSTSSPTSVTVAGRSYPIETSAAAYALSNLGSFHVGDSVTLLLGRSGGVAGVVDASVAAPSGERVGVVTAVTQEPVPDGHGGTYVTQMVTLLATDGEEYQYQYQGTGMRTGAVVRAAVSPQTGEVTLGRASSVPVSGTVNRDGTKLGKYSFAQGIRILDVSDHRGIIVYPSRLANLELTSGMVRYCGLNGQGEIEKLILDDVTGDAYHYGVLIGVEQLGDESYSSYSYTYDIAGTPGSVMGVSTKYPVSSATPIRLLGEIGQPDRLQSLTSAGRGGLVGGQFVSEGRHYALAPNVLVYEVRDNVYTLSSLARAESGEFSLTAWYDRPESAGGRIRVILAKPV